jgi:hypothetical protein
LRHRSFSHSIIELLNSACFSAAFAGNATQIPHAIAVFSDGAFFRAGWDRTHYKNLTVELAADFRGYCEATHLTEVYGNRFSSNT